ncbi:MAG: MFS transporter [Chloroflexi bacterium]|nr:MFS transporter [Chloroflexota bacterium]
MADHVRRTSRSRSSLPAGPYTVHMSERARRIFYLIVLPLGHASVDMPGGALWLIAPAVGLAWGLSPAEVGLLITAHNVGAGLGYLPSGILADRFSRRGLMLTATIWWVVIGYAAASFAPGYWTFALLLAFAAVGDAAWHPMATGAMVQHMPRRRALALGVHLSGGMLAEVLGPLVVGFLLGYLDWRVVFRLAIIPAALMGLAMLYLHRYVEPSRDPALTRSDLRDIFSVWRTPAGAIMFGLGVSYSMSFVALLAMSPLFFQTYHGYSSAWAGVAFAVMLLGGAISAPVMGQVSDRWGRKRIVVLSAIAASGGILLAAFSSSPFLLLPGVIIGGTALSGMRPVYLAAAVEMVGKRESTSLGLVYAVMDGLGALGGLLAGLAGTNDLRFALVFAAGAALLSGAFAVVHPFEVRDVGSSRPIAMHDPR